MYVLHLSVDCQGCFFVRLVCMEIQIYDRCACRPERVRARIAGLYHQVPGTSIIEIVVPPWMIVPILILISIVTHVRTKRRTVPTFSHGNSINPGDSPHLFRKKIISTNIKLIGPQVLIQN
jgi:hypothetical protein